LNKERYLAIAVKMNEDLSQSFQALLCSSKLKELKVLDSSKIGSFVGMDKVNIIPTLLHWETSGEFIFTGNTDEYELRVFDFNGNLVRRIKKEFEAVLLTENDKERYKQRILKYPPDIKDKFFVLEAYPPFRNIVAFSDNRLFVQTYEVLNEGAAIFDIFNSEGVFINRAELEGIPQKFRGDSVYCLKEKSSGYMELVVYRMIWQ